MKSSKGLPCGDSITGELNMSLKVLPFKLAEAITNCSGK